MRNGRVTPAARFREDPFPASARSGSVWLANETNAESILAHWPDGRRLIPSACLQDGPALRRLHAGAARATTAYATTANGGGGTGRATPTATRRKEKKCSITQILR